MCLCKQPGPAPLPTRSLGVAAGEFRPATPRIVAGLLAGGAQLFNQPDVLAETGIDLAAATDELLDLVIRSLRP